MLTRAYHESKGEGKRNLVLVPDSSHGTNPASAAQYGYQVSVALSYLFSRYLSFASSYTFQARMGDESSDASKGHTWKSGMQISF